MYLTVVWLEAGGDDEFQGLVDYTFTRPDGTQLGTQAHCAWLQDCKSLFLQASEILLTNRILDPDGFRQVRPSTSSASSPSIDHWYSILR